MNILDRLDHENKEFDKVYDQAERVSVEVTTQKEEIDQRQLFRTTERVLSDRPE